MGISICPVETYTLQGRCYEAEITLIGELQAYQIGIACILGLCEAGIYIALVLVVGADLVYDEVIDFL